MLRWASVSRNGRTCERHVSFCKRYASQKVCVMALGEFELIQRYFADLTAKVPNSNLIVGIGDDCAVLAPDNQHCMAISTDTLVSGIHFPENTSAADIGWKALAVNLSDLAAMGASPNWFNLALTLPNADANWVKAFAEGMAELISLYPINLIGGDTTRGALSITITVAGNLPIGKTLLRSGAKIGDSIFVSGNLGDAGKGLQLWQQGKSVNAAEVKLIQRLIRPRPRIALGQNLLNIASSCIDISDGLLGDLGHICERSGVAAEMDAELIPLSEELLSVESKQAAMVLALTAGDDYELCFTAAAEKDQEILRLMQRLDVSITKIGRIIRNDLSSENKMHILNFDSPSDFSAYQHFKANE